MENLNTSELLLPVGNYQMCLAAIHNGADAIYVGMPGFNARGRSYDHEMDELKEIIDTCHLYGVKVHIAFNILIFQNELEKAIEKLDQVVALGPDAFIVQDVGLIKLINERYPTIEVHGSTQMTVTCHDAIELYEDLDIKRFVLGRENSLDEIKIIRENTNKELEVFVHGALCVAYSGQCFTSEAIGGRSANRGQCAQSCRFEYDLFVDGKQKQLVDKKYLVSPKDLCGLNEVSKLKELGINSFKVEGRLKSPQFVASVASSYRNQIDGKLTNPSQAMDMMQINFSRGFFSGWLHGVSHQNLVGAQFSSHRGIYLGNIKIDKNTVLVKTDFEIQAGDGVLFAHNSKKEDVGAKVYTVTKQNGFTVLSFSKGFDLKSLNEETQIYLNSSDKLDKELTKSFSDRNYFKKIPISIVFTTKIDCNAILEVTDGNQSIEVLSQENVSKSINAPAELNELEKFFSGLTHTVYELKSFKWVGDKEVFISNKNLKALKRELIEKLNNLRTVPKIHPQHNIDRPELKYRKETISPKLTILIRTYDQLNAIKKLSSQYKNYIEKVVLDFEFGKDYGASVTELKELGIKSIIATTRILKPREYHNLKAIMRANPDGILVRNAGALQYLQDSGLELYADFGLNISNSISANYFISKGIKKFCPSYDLSFDELIPMLECVDTSKVEITLHQYMPEFHMEHCVFAAFLSKGNSFKDCGKPCEKHTVELKDMFGNVHHIKADQECRNTMFRATPQSAAKFIEQWIELGVESYRFEALHEKSEDLQKKLEVYLKLMSKDLNSLEVYEMIGSVENYGVSTGQLLNSRSYRSRKKE